MSVQGDDALALQRALAQLSAEVRTGSSAVVTEKTMVLEARTKRHASQPRSRPRPRTGGPEGPRLLSGGYVASIHSQVDVGPVSATGRVGSNDVRAWPLEVGNQTTGSLSYPHYGPAMDETEAEFLAAMAAVPVAAARKTRGGRARGFLARLFGRAS